MSPTVNITSGSSDGVIYGQDAAYSTARSTSYYGDQSPSLHMIEIGQGTTFAVYRGFFLFDTSVIPDTAKITKVNLKLTFRNDYIAPAFDIQIVKTNWADNTDFSDATERENAYDNCLSDDADDSIFKNTLNITKNTPYTSGNLDVDWVSKTGITYYGIRSKNDKDNTTPTEPEAQQIFISSVSTASYRPILVVEYSVADLMMWFI